MEKHLLGTGLLSAHSSERITGRFGTVQIFAINLLEEICENPSDLAVKGLLGHHGQIIAIQNDHEFLLGTGTLFVEEHIPGQMSVGVRPDDPSVKEDWLDFNMLYQLDGIYSMKTVELYFVEENKDVQRRTS